MYPHPAESIVIELPIEGKDLQTETEAVRRKQDGANYNLIGSQSLMDICY